MTTGTDRVTVTAADFNPHSEQPWDDRPFDSVPQWLVEAIESGSIQWSNDDGTDYATWVVRTPSSFVRARPGDTITHSTDHYGRDCYRVVHLEQTRVVRQLKAMAD